jgi:hypothetical protein
MTTISPHLTDDRLRQALSELAAGPESDLLLAGVLRIVDSQTQVGRRAWDTRGWGRASLLIAAVGLLVAAAIGATVTFSHPQPSPQPTHTPLPLSSELIRVTDFVVPFTYRLPVGTPAQLQPYGSLDKLYFIDARAGGPGRLTLFPVNGIVHGCGTGAGNGLPTSTVALDPAAFLEALRDTYGAGIGPTRPSVLGNLPAVGADVDPKLGTCVSVAIHLDGLGLSYAQYEPSLSSPGRLIVARTQGRTVAVLISASSAEALTEWLPIGEAFVDGMVFQ